MQPLAHSGRAARGLGPQDYRDHVRAVKGFAVRQMRAALRYRTSLETAFETRVELAGEFHDLGKLEPENQTVLRTRERGGLPINHVDAGVAYLSELRETEAAIAVYGHHIGLCDIPAERAKEALARQDPAQAACRDYKIKLATDARLPHLLVQHREAVPAAPVARTSRKRAFTGLERRLLLSCLVDGDHTDTARHYGDQPDLSSGECRWVERLAALDRYVAGLVDGDPGSRDALRSKIYEVCRSASPGYFIWACDSPVGSGKTTAIMAYLLQAAISLGLRHIFVVLPYTNIVQQSVDVYRKALVLPGEDPAKIVAAHHHQAEFKSADLRFLTTLWDAPIIVTTAVQFFETLGANQTPSLRKLHQLPGSAAFVDEAHAAMPIHLWPFMWEQIKSLAGDWSCRFVLGSGSLAKFWENPRILGEGKTENIPPMIPAGIRAASSIFEQSRVAYKTRLDALSLAQLCDWIQDEAGPRLVVLNTVQSAAVVARELRDRGVSTLHLSTALAPIHRKVILRLIRRRLKTRPKLDWVLVATSCVEAGVDFSFATAFRERCRTSSLVQIGGRVNRHGERSDGVVWDFIVNDPVLTLHPDFKETRDVVEDIFRKAMWDRDLTELMTYALEQEFKLQSGEKKIEKLFEREGVGAYPDVAELTRLINSDTRLVVIDPRLIAAIADGERIDRRELIARSVQLWSRKIGKLALNPIGYGTEELYAWGYDYDPKFLGIMAGVLKMNQIDRDGYAFV
jgi:CRISPR-associated endonuclease/helicase Cas3